LNPRLGDVERALGFNVVTRTRAAYGQLDTADGTVRGAWVDVFAVLARRDIASPQSTAWGRYGVG
jgi:hypothetical protein